MGTTHRSTMAGGRFIHVNIAEAAFSSEELLFLVSGHELFHADHFLRGLDFRYSPADFQKYTEGSAWNWTLDAWHDNRWINTSGFQDLNVWEGYGRWGEPYNRLPQSIKSIFNSSTIRKIFK